MSDKLPTKDDMSTTPLIGIDDDKQYVHCFQDLGIRYATHKHLLGKVLWIARYDQYKELLTGEPSL